MNDKKSIMSLIHNMNTIKTENLCVLNESQAYDFAVHYGGIRKRPRPFSGLTRGLHIVNFTEEKQVTRKTRVYAFNIPYDMAPGDSFIINDKNFGTYYDYAEKTNFPIPIYRCIDIVIDPAKGGINGGVTIPTIDSYLDMALLSADKSVSLVYPELDDPIDVSSMFTHDKIQLFSNGSNTNVLDDKSIKSIGSFGDSYLLDNITNRSFIRYRTNLEIISGMEQMSRIESFSTKHFSTYFIKNDLALNPLYITKPGFLELFDDNWRMEKLNSIQVVSSHFRTVSYETLRRPEFEDNAICLFEDKWRGNGFYIKIANSICPDVSSFLKMLNSGMYKSNPLKVLYPLAEDYIQDTRPMNTKISTIYPFTKIYTETGVHMNCSLFFRAPLGTIDRLMNYNYNEGGMI